MIKNRRNELPEKKNHVIMNDMIRSNQLYVIGVDGPLGLMSRNNALQKAFDLGLDLILVSAEANPPVAKIQDHSKYVFELQKKDRQARANSRGHEPKEIRLSPTIGDNDLQVKANQARNFLEDNHRVQVCLIFHGREVTHTSIGRERIMKFTTMLADVGTVEGHPRLEGKKMHLTVVPSRQKRISA